MLKSGGTVQRMASQRVTRARQILARRSPSAAFRLFRGGGGYNAARSDRPALREWRPLLGGPNSDTLPDLTALRSRSADLERNAPLATGAVNTVVTSTVGPGIVPHARIDRTYLGLTDDQAEAWEMDAERIFDAVASTPKLDLADRLDFWEMQALALRATLTRGDLFAIRRMVPRPGDLLETRIQLVEADRVSNPLGTLETDRFMGGIEFDEHGVQVRIHVSEQHPGELSGALRWIAEDVYGRETGQRRVLHIMDTLRVNQARGVPFLAPVIEMLKQLDRYSESEIASAVVNSFFAVFFTSPAAGDEASDLLDMGGIGSAEDMRSVPGQERDVRLKPGMAITLQPGEDVKQTNVSRPNPQFDPFVLAVLRQIGVALELPYEFLVKHFTASYSASRAAILEAWRSVTRRRSWLVARFCQPVYEWVIEEAVARGLLEAPGFFENPLIRRAYCGAEWIGVAMGSLDPESDVAAAAMRVQEGFSTREEETAQMTGGHYLTKHRVRVMEERLRRRDGLSVDSPAERIATPNDEAAAGVRRRSLVRQEFDAERQRERELAYA